MCAMKTEKVRRSLKREAPSPSIPEGERHSDDEADGLEGLVLLGLMKSVEGDNQAGNEEPQGPGLLKGTAKGPAVKRRKSKDGGYLTTAGMQEQLANSHSKDPGPKRINPHGKEAGPKRIKIKGAKPDAKGKGKMKVVTLKKGSGHRKQKEKVLDNGQGNRGQSPPMVGTTRIKGEILGAFCDWGAGEGISSGRHAIQRLLDIEALSMEDLEKEKYKAPAKPVQMLLNRQQVVNVRGPPGAALYKWAMAAGLVDRPSADIVEALFNSAMTKLRAVGLPVASSSHAKMETEPAARGELRTPAEVMEGNGFCRKVRTSRGRPASNDFGHGLDFSTPPFDGGSSQKGLLKGARGNRLVRTNLLSKMGDDSEDVNCKMAPMRKAVLHNMATQTEDWSKLPVGKVLNAVDLVTLEELKERVQRKQIALEEEEVHLSEEVMALNQQRLQIAMEMEELMKRRDEAVRKVNDLERVAAGAAAHPHGICGYANSIEDASAMSNGEGG